MGGGPRQEDGPMEPLRVMMVPLHSRVGDIEGNLAKMLGRCDEAEGNGADLVCFPELSLTGYAMPHSRGLAMPDDHPALASVSERTEGSDLSICFGYVDEEGHIVQAVASNGRIAGRYCKTHLGEREQGVMTPGGSFPIMDLGKAKVGISICWEAHFPEIAGTYALEGADVILMPFASGLGGERRQSSWDRFLPARAYDNTVFVAAVNAFGDTGAGTMMGGGAAAYNVRGERIGYSYGSQTLTVDLDPEQMDRIRAGHYESMRDVYFLDKRRPGLYGRITEG